MHRVRREDLPEDVKCRVIRRRIELDHGGRIRRAHDPDGVTQAELHRQTGRELRDLVEHQPRGQPVKVAHSGWNRGGREGRVAGGSGIEVAGVTTVGAPGCRTGTGGVRVGIEVAAGVRLHDFEAVNRPRVDTVILVEPVLGDLRRVHVIDQKATAARGRRAGVEPHLAVVVKHRAVGLYLLAIFQQEVLAA